MKSRQNRKLLGYQECRLKRSGLRQFLNNAHEQRPGVHIQTSFFTIIVKDTVYHPISGDKPIWSLEVTFCIACRVFCSDGFPYVIAPAFSTPAFPTLLFTPAFSAPAFSIPAIYSCFFHSCIFHSRIFSAPQALYMLRQIRPSIRLFVRHTPVLCLNETTQRDAVFTIG